MFLKKSKNLLGIKTSKQTYLEYKKTILCRYVDDNNVWILLYGIHRFYVYEIDFRSLFSPLDFKKNDDIILDYFVRANF